ncbi:hypothetical protein QFZ27_001915 [Inquilinus ginsengisoli]|uniref:hypothetical protein n=1 Tax=Inquilinus ginsengisoli TaxID=363840 RepID=UPI003D1D7A9C
MSGVLTRLAERALGVAMVRPRLGGLFEAAPVRLELSETEAESPAAPLAATPPPTGAAAPLRAALRERPASTRRESPNALDVTAFEPPEPTARARAPGSEIFAAAPTPSEAPARIERPPSPPRADRIATPPARSRRGTVSSESPDPPAQAASYRPLLPERAPLATAGPARSPRPERAPQGEPDINITIGRIEVRGEPERRAPKAPARPPPKLMPLEEYLAKGRGRRG